MTNYKICRVTGKRSHLSKQEAESFENFSRQQYPLNALQHAYQCEHCVDWHLSSKCPKTGKRSFATEQEAAKFEEENRQTYSNPPQYPYPCEDCAAWHLSSTPNGNSRIAKVHMPAAPVEATPVAPAVPAGKVAVASTSREEIHKMHASGLSGAEIARRLGLDRTTVYAHINTPLDAPIRTQVDTAEIMRLRETGMQISDIAKQLNIPISTLYSHLPPTDRDRPQGKTREEVRRLKANGMSAAQIAKELGVSVPTVYHHLSSGSTNPVGGKPGRPPKNPVVSLVDISQRRQELAEQAAALQRKLTELQETEERLRESARMKFEIVGDNVVIRKNQEEVTVSFADVEELHKAVTMPATMTA